MLTLLAVLAGGYLLLTGALYVFQRNLIYFPDTSRPVMTGNLSGLSEVTVETADGLQLLCWYGQPRPGMATVLYFHGNAGNIASRVEKIRPFVNAGYGVLLVGYRGYGGNGGSPSEQGFYADARGAVQYLKNLPKPPARLIIYGESLGTAVAVRTAADLAAAGEAIEALVLEAPFTSVVEAAAHYYPIFPIKWLLKDRFDSASRIARVEAPVLIVHGQQDATIPIRLGRELYQLAAQPKQKLWIAGAGHNDLFDHGAAEAVLEFLAGLANR